MGKGTPPGAAAKLIWLTAPTAPCVLSLQRDKANDSLTNNTCRLYILAEDGGDATGAVVKLYFDFYASKAGGTS
jgi:hypothetical protein